MTRSPRHDIGKKPSKPYPSFPLTAHNNGQWCKKVRGKLHFFGVWADPQAAQDNYLAVAADLHAGRQPRSASVPCDGITIKDASNRYLTHQLQRSEAGDIGHRWFEDCRCVLQAFAQFVGSGRIVEDLTADDFQKFRQRLLQRGLNGRRKGLGVHAMNRAITVVRGLFKYVYDTDLIDRPIKYGKGFDRPSATSKRRARRLAEDENGKRLFEPASILAFLKKADEPLRTMILLGINGGFGNTDCARLPMAAVDLEHAVIEFERPKTGIDRTVPLWPETVEAMQRLLQKRPAVVDENAKRLSFVTPSGRPWVRETVHRREDNVIVKVTRVDAIASNFTDLLEGLGLKRKGIGFYTLRHTFRTWADEVPDQHAIHRIMGHTIPGMSGIYVEEIELPRLRAVVDHVRARLFVDSDDGAKATSE